MKKETKIERWIKNGNPPLLAELLNQPVMRDALEILDEIAQPNDSALLTLAKRLGDSAPFAISMTHATQAGERRMLKTLRYLASASQVDSIASAGFYDHIDEKYLDLRAQSQTA